jgi:hypothetical protein
VVPLGAALTRKGRSIDVLVTGTFPPGVCPHTLFRLNHGLSGCLALNLFCDINVAKNLEGCTLYYQFAPQNERGVQ